jgi:hypothetical protein
VRSANEAAASLLSAAAVRERCAVVTEAAERGDTRHFRLVPDRLDEAARRVAEITRRRFPDLDVPYHSRWRHFRAGGLDRAALVAPGVGPAETARARIDLAVVSVLLDAGVGGEWRYREAETGCVLGRSEGLAVASLRAMQRGLFSADPEDPWRADAAILAQITAEQLAGAFQHGRENPLAGIEGRTLLLRRAGEVCAGLGRLGSLYDTWAASREPVAAAEILRALLVLLGPVWPGRPSLGGIPLGDCGRHSAVLGDGLVPFHKLSQWLAYSLIEPLATAGVPVVGLNGLTGLAEYRNGGLFVDCGVVEPRDPGLLHRSLDPWSEPVVEWRALTVTLLDRLAERVRERLGKSAADFPLAKVLEGGSWAAGREIAFERRPDGRPPLRIGSDGTLF